MTNLQPPRPGGSGARPPQPSNVAGRPSPTNVPGGSGSPFAQQNRLRVVQGGGAVSSRTVLGTFLGLVAIFVLSLVLTPFPPSQRIPAASNFVGFFAGLFGCTLIFGLLQFFINQQYAAGTFADWNFPIAKITVAKVLTGIGWVAGGTNGYIIAVHIARSVA